LQLSSTSRSEVVKQLETTMISSSDAEGRLGLRGIDAQQESVDHYSCVGANSNKSCVDQRDRWAIKFRSGMNLFDLIKL